MYMEIFKVTELEKNNSGDIYLFANHEELFMAYELSAYIASRFIPSVNLRRYYSFYEGRMIFAAVISPEVIRTYFSGSNTRVGNDYVQVSLSGSLKEKIPMWNRHFEELNKICSLIESR